VLEVTTRVRQGLPDKGVVVRWALTDFVNSTAPLAPSDQRAGALHSACRPDEMLPR
jgi:hypothetical protein